MRIPRPLLLLPLCTLSGCNGAQSFDEKYEDQAANISAAANDIEQQVRNQLSSAAQAEQAATELRSRATVANNAVSVP